MGLIGYKGIPRSCDDYWGELSDYQKFTNHIDEEIWKTIVYEKLSECYSIAKDSPDRSNQNGALLFSRTNSEIIGRGCNKFLPKTDVTDELLNNREKKLFYIEHSERNAIFQAINSPFANSVKNSILFCPWFACADCARAIVLCGIKHVVGHKERMDQTPERWKASVEAGLELMRLHEVQLEFYSGQLGCDKIIVNGELWQP